MRPTLDFYLRRHLAAESFGNRVAAELADALTRAQRDLSGFISALDGDRFLKRHYLAVRTRVNDQIKALLDEYGPLLDKRRREALQTEYDRATRAFKEAAQERVRESSAYRIPGATVSRIMAGPVGGEFLDEWIQRHLGGLKAGIQRELTQSIIQGEGMNQAAGRLRNVFGLSRRGANVIARTSIMHASNAARDEVHREMAQYITGFRVVGTLDIRTCIACAPLDGQESTDRTELPFFPLHFLCRCVVIALTVWDKDGDRTRPAVTSESRSTVRHRDGSTSTRWTVGKAESVSEKTSFREFFDRQPAAWQRQYLGRSRYELYRTGKLSLADMAKNNRILSLEELN